MADPARSRRTHLRALPDQGGEPPAPPRDAELIAAIRRGDRSVGAAFYDRLAGVIDRTLFRVFGTRESDHDDLVQCAFEQVVLTLSREQFAGACSLETWASRVASHVGLNALRSRRRERRWVDRSEGADLAASRRSAPGDADRAADARARLLHVRRHLAELKPDHAEALFLHDALGHDLAEIAVLTGVSVAAAQSRLVRGRKELFRRLDENPLDSTFGRIR